MPKITIEGGPSVEVPASKRLINALIDDAKVDQHFSCGGQAKCTTCRVQYVAGEPQKITEAEKNLLIASNIDLNSGTRLSCQILCDHDMTVKLISPKPPNKNPNHPADEIVPPAVWTTK
jgi:ferredoxin